jgi:hypothetical protein
VNHKSKNTHLCGTAVVQLNSTLGKLGLFIESIPAEVNGTVTEITNKVSWGGTVGGILHDSKLKETNEGKDLKGSSYWNLKRASPSLSDIRELGTRLVNGTWKVDTGTGGDLSKEGKLSNTSVLNLDVS